MIKKLLYLFSFLVFNISSFAQQKKKKPLCNPLIIGNLPKKQWSLQGELQSGFKNSYTEYRIPNNIKGNNTYDGVPSLRASFYKPIITKPKSYVTFEAGYWLSSFYGKNLNSVITNQPQGNDVFTLYSVTAATTIFKPIDDKHFILINASVEANGNAAAFTKLSGQNILVGGAAIYGWKKSYNQMTGIGILRAYRLGKLIHVPAFLWNKNFNKKWGVEALLPARATFRYAANKKTFAVAGFDLEGTQYLYTRTLPLQFNTFVQRGEVKTKVGLDTELSKRVRLTAQMGARFMARFNWSSDKKGNELVIENNAKPNLYANVGLHLMPKPKAKKK